MYEGESLRYSFYWSYDRMQIKDDYTLNKAICQIHNTREKLYYRKILTMKKILEDQKTAIVVSLVIPTQKKLIIREMEPDWIDIHILYPDGMMRFKRSFAASHLTYKGLKDFMVDLSEKEYERMH